MYTPMHRALGREPTEVTYELLTECVEQRVRESEDLDWKGALPMESGDPKWKDEWAKDVAAMANSGGGCLVYGVAEHRPSSAADHLVDVGSVTQQLENQLRQVAGSAIRPTVARLQFIEVVGDAGRALVVRIPASPDLPHILVEGQHGFRAPFRYGATTGWMSERDLERAYRLRFRRTAELEATLGKLYQATSRHAEHLLAGEMGSGIALVGAAVPVEPQPEVEFSSEQAADRLLAATDLTYAITGIEHSGSYDLGTVPGLRRLVTPASPVEGVQTSLHFDGSVTLIQKLSAGAIIPGYGGPVLPADEAEIGVVRLVATLAAMARATGETVSYAVTIGVRWPDALKALRFSKPDRNVTDRHRLIEPVQMVHEVEAFTREVRGDAALEDLRGQARVLALDLLRQGGVDRTSVIPAS